MIRWLNRRIAERQLKKWQTNVANDYNIVQELRKLTDAGFQQDRAMAILNAIVAYVDHERNKSNVHNR